MTDGQIKEVLRKYIVGIVESDNADCLHEMDEFYADENEETASDDMKRAYEFYRTAKVTVTFND